MENPGQYLTEQEKEYIDRLILDRLCGNLTICVSSEDGENPFSCLIVDRIWNSAMLGAGSQGFPRFTFYKQGQGPRKHNKQLSLWNFD